MPVEITKTLTPALQELSDAREVVKEMEAKVESVKAKLKAAKQALEEAQGDLNLKIDAMIEAERSPSLLDFASSNETDAAPQDLTPGPSSPSSPTIAPEPGEPASVSGAISSSGSPSPSVEEIIDAEFTVNPPSVPSLPAVTVPFVPKWRELIVADELDGPAHLFDAFAEFGIETLGHLADHLKEDYTFGLTILEVDSLKESIEQFSEADPFPIRFDTFKKEVPADPEPDVKPVATTPTEPATQTEQPKKRGRKKKNPETLTPVASTPPTPVEPNPVEPDPIEPEPAAVVDQASAADPFLYDPFADL